MQYTTYTKSPKNRKTVAIDCRQCYFRFVVILPPEFEAAKFSRNTGITPKSNENSELKKKNEGTGSKLTGNGRDYMQTLLFPVYRRVRCKIEIPESRKNIGIRSIAVLNDGLAHASDKL